MAQSTWAAKTETWATDTHVWANTTYQDSALINSTTSFDLGYNTKYVVDANLTQLNLSELHEEDAVKLAGAILGLSSGVSASGLLLVPVLGTLSNEQTIKNNVNFEESASMSMTNTTSSDNNFLWNDITEDTGTTWTKVADADE